VDGQVRKQIQNGQTNTYSIDPAGRVHKTVGEGTTNLTAIDHYDGGGEALAWRDEGEGKYTRLIPGIDGSPCATQTNGGTPVLQLYDLQGDVVGTAALSETETKLLSTYNSTEFGVQVNGPPPTKYSWLGAEAVSSELSSGSVIMGTVSYVPQLGRLLETQAVIPPGMAINGAQGVPFTAQASTWSIQANETQARTDQENYEAELQRAAEQEAEEKACAIGSMCQAPGENYSPYEGAEEYDPEGLASYKTTMKRAQELHNDAAKGLAAGLLADLVLAGVAEGGAAYAAELELSAASLESCVAVGKGTSGEAGRWGTCFINETKFLGVPISAEAEFCEYRENRSWGKKSHNYYYCLGSGEVRSGPWY
jgi:hypothetical protein